MKIEKGVPKHLKGNKHKNRFIILLIFIFFLLLVWSVRLNASGDDSILFLTPLNQQFGGSFTTFLSHRYSTWSSRVVIELFVLLSLKIPYFWKLITSLAMTILVISPLYFSKKKGEEVNPAMYIFSALLFFLIPITLHNETGWVATSANYLWVLAFGLFSLFPIKQILVDEHYSRSLYALSLPALFFASNQEQMCMILLLVLGTSVVYLATQARSFLALIPHLVVVGVNLLVILLSPGNQARFDQEVHHWFPEYNELSFFQKIDIGYSSSLKKLFVNSNTLFFLLALLLFVLILYKTSALVPIIITGIPVVSSFILGPAFPLFRDYLPGVQKLLNAFEKTGTSFELFQPLTWYPNLLLTIILGSVVFGILYYYDDKKEALFPLSLLFLGLVSRMILAFSPTVWASGRRVYLFAFFALILLIMHVSQKAYETSKDKVGLKLFLGLAAGLGCIHMFNFIMLLPEILKL